jgi:hypothetical protein
MKDLDPYQWGAATPNPRVSDPDGLLLHHDESPPPSPVSKNVIAMVS